MATRTIIIHVSGQEVVRESDGRLLLLLETRQRGGALVDLQVIDVEFDDEDEL